MHQNKVYLLAPSDAGCCPKTSLQQMSRSCPCLQVEAPIRCKSGIPKHLSEENGYLAAKPILVGYVSCQAGGYMTEWSQPITPCGHIQYIPAAEGSSCNHRLYCTFYIFEELRIRG